MLMATTETPLCTGYANAVSDYFPSYLVTAGVYSDCQTERELNAARLTEARAEDRFIAAIAGALPSEIWT